MITPQETSQRSSDSLSQKEGMGRVIRSSTKISALTISHSLLSQLYVILLQLHVDSLLGYRENGRLTGEDSPSLWPWGGCHGVRLYADMGVWG